MSEFGDIAILKQTFNLIPTDMNQFLKIEFSEKQFSKNNFFQKTQKIEKNIFFRKKLKKFFEKNRKKKF